MAHASLLAHRSHRRSLVELNLCCQSRERLLIFLKEQSDEECAESQKRKANASIDVSQHPRTAKPFANTLF